ncbi:hypothetical protein [Mesorhizobium loti]|uniref:hypothetical protein n=1 Tax=Rhizobium loti TaxID=381 RepID=UPI00041240B3|nr:hypothetical protein [Mesorhizobium loti]
MSPKIGGPAVVDWEMAPEAFVITFSRAIFFLRFFGPGPCEQKFPGSGESVENSFSNRLLPGLVLHCSAVR